MKSRSVTCSMTWYIHLTRCLMWWMTLVKYASLRKCLCQKHKPSICFMLSLQETQFSCNICGPGTVLPRWQQNMTFKQQLRETQMDLILPVQMLCLFQQRSICRFPHPSQSLLKQLIYLKTWRQGLLFHFSNHVSMTGLPFSPSLLSKKCVIILGKWEHIVCGLCRFLHHTKQMLSYALIRQNVNFRTTIKHLLTLLANTHRSAICCPETIELLLAGVNSPIGLKSLA